MVERLRANAPSTFRLSRREHLCRKKTVLARESAVNSSLQTRRYLFFINTCLSIDFILIRRHVMTKDIIQPSHDFASHASLARR